MPILTRCQHCQKLARVADVFAQRQVRCPFCKEVFVARAVEDEAPTAVRPPNSSPIQPVAQSVSLPRPNGAVNQASSLTIPAQCPGCKAPLHGKATCGQCGWMPAANGLHVEAEEQPLICTNPACGTANHRQARYCARCQAMLPSPPGTMLHGRYRVDKLLAIGGFGGVYLAHDVQANRPVAIKDMLASDPAEFATRLNFFRREAEILRLLDHSPIVPRVYDFIEDGQSAHLMMEYIPGKDLLQVLDSQGGRPFAIDLVAQWGQQICDVLTLLHSQQPSIIHRDLKPDNIMLLEDGKSIRLIDFGTARELGKTAKSRVAAKTRVYTEGYAPPEQVIGKPELRSDLFALAGTLYQLLTGKAPEGQYTAMELRDMLGSQPGSIPTEHRWLYEIIATNLAEDANDRYFTAREIKADLQRKAVTTSAICPACRHINKVREPHCSQCATPLTEVMPGCLNCGKLNRQGSRFCIQCGMRLR